MKLTSATFAYPMVDGSIRADLATRLAREKVGESVFVLSTCLRIEVLVVGDRRRLDATCGNLFGDATLVEHASTRYDHEALTHIFRVVSGLESPIVGEREILTQFRQALTELEAMGSVGGLMAKLLETAVAVGRQVRHLMPDSPHDSMAAVAAQMVGGSERVAVLGAGAMGRAVAHSLLALPAPPEITMIVRSPENVDIPGVRVAPMSEAGSALAEWPAVVSATSATGRLVPDQEVAGFLELRSGPLILVDLAMPPDIAPPASPAIQHIDIDDLARRAQRTVDTAEADRFVEHAALDAFRHAGTHHEIGPVIGEMMRSADDIVDRIVKRFEGRLGSGDDRGVLRQTAHTVARTLLAAPVSFLRSTERPREAVDLLMEAFAIGEQA